MVITQKFRSPYFGCTFEHISVRPYLGLYGETNGILFVWKDKTIRYYPEIRIGRNGMIAMPENMKEAPIGYAILETSNLDISIKNVDEQGREIPEGEE